MFPLAIPILYLHSSIVLLIPDIDDYEQSEIMNLHSSIVLLIHPLFSPPIYIPV